MKDEFVDLEPLADWRVQARGERVIGAVLEAASARAAPRGDLVASILILGRPALAAAVILAVATVAATAVPAKPGGDPITIGGALGVPPSGERAIRGERAVDAREMLAILEEMR
jgi:hypothetical protein